MLDEVHIRGLGVIEDATLRPGPGLTVLTGETGAGKTLLVTALEQLAGARADSSLVRAGADEALIEARLVPAPPAAGDWAGGDDELVLARELPAEGGASRARIGGRLAPIGTLREVLGPSVEIHTQHAHLRLSRPAVQRDLLDRFAGGAQRRTLAGYRDTHREWREATDALERLRDDVRARTRELDRLEHEVDEIESAGLDPERDGDLAARIDRLAHAEELRLALAEAAAALGSEGAGDPLGVAVSALRRMQVDDPRLRELRERTVDLTAEVTELARDLRSYGEEIEADPGRLEELRARQRLVRQLERKYGEGVDGILGYARQAAERIGELRSAAAESSQLEQRVGELGERLDEQAVEVREGRRRAAGRLAEVVEGHLADLAMPHAEVSIEVIPTDPGPDGADEVAFLLAANPGEPPVPLGEGASGGERSRVALAIEVALADVNDARILVFDEVDAGVGGATAMAVGEKLARVAAGPVADGGRRQVLCVTHLPQLAAWADTHYVVEKGVEEGRTTTTVRRVGEGRRAAELARMLSGDATGDAGLAHARELLEAAAAGRA